MTTAPPPPGGGYPLTSYTLNAYFDGGEYGDPSMVAQVVEHFHNEQHRLACLAQKSLIGSELQSAAFPRARAEIADASEGTVTLLRAVASGPDEKLVLVHLRLEVTLQLHLLLIDHATPQVGDLSAPVVVQATASYDRETQEFGNDLDLVLPTLDSMPGFVEEMNDRREPPMSRVLPASGVLPPDTLEAIRQMSNVAVPPGTLEAIRQMSNVAVPPDTLEAIRQMTTRGFPTQSPPSDNVQGDEETDS